MSQRTMLIPTGLKVSICPESEPKQGIAHVMRKDVEAKEYRSETMYGSSGAVIFLVSGWFIMTRREKLK